MRSTLTDDIECSPEVSSHLKTLKRKASDISDQTAPNFARAFLKWRLQCIDADLEYIDTAFIAVTEAKREAEYHEQYQQERSSLEFEKIQLLGNIVSSPKI